MKIKKRVRLGAALMDEHKPGWYKKVNLETFDINYSTKCIFAQCFPNGGAKDKLGIQSYEEEVQCGFHPAPEDFTVQITKLNRRWIKEIKKRRRK